MRLMVGLFGYSIEIRIFWCGQLFHFGIVKSIR